MRCRKLSPEGREVLWLEELTSSEKPKVFFFFPRDAPAIMIAIMGKSPPLVPFDFSLALKIQLCQRCIQRLAGFLQASWGFQKLVLSKVQLIFRRSI